MLQEAPGRALLSADSGEVGRGRGGGVVFVVLHFKKSIPQKKIAIKHKQDNIFLAGFPY